jgi:ABC-type glycerol-3-phosphate transport system substrate-binding protein
MSRKLSRRDLLKGIGAVALSTPLLYACAPQQTVVVVEEAPKEEAPKEEAPAPVEKEKPTLRLTLWAEQSGEGRTWPQDKGLEWAEQTGLADVEIEMVSYNEMPTKQLTAVAAGTLWDVMFNNNKIGPYNAYKGVYLWLDDLIDAYETDMTDYFPAAVEGSSFEGKVYALPCETNTGNQNICFYNKDLLDQFGVDSPPRTGRSRNTPRWPPSARTRTTASLAPTCCTATTMTLPAMPAGSAATSLARTARTLP